MKLRILSAKDMLGIALRAAEKTFTKEDVALSIERALDKVTSPDVHSQMHFSDGIWIVDIGPDVYADSDPQNLMMLYSEWLKVLAQFVNSLDSKKLGKFIDTLTATFCDEFVDRYSGYDLSGLEEFSFWLDPNRQALWH